MYPTRYHIISLLHIGYYNMDIFRMFSTSVQQMETQIDMK